MENQAVQVFTLERVNPELGRKLLLTWKLIMAIFLVVGLMMVYLRRFLYVLPFFFAASCFYVIILLIIVSIKKNRIQQILELRGDSLVITGIEDEVIKFGAVRYCRQGRGRFKWTVLRIGLEDGREKAISAGRNAGLKPFILAFEESIKEYTRINNLPELPEG
jgi:hypothetical protein